MKSFFTTLIADIEFLLVSAGNGVVNVADVLYHFRITLLIFILVFVVAAFGRGKYSWEANYSAVVNVGNKCTGFVHKDGFVVTAGHCFEKGDKLTTVYFVDGKSGLFEVVCREYQEVVGIDYAVLRGNTYYISGYTKKILYMSPFDPNFYHVGYGERQKQTAYPAGYFREIDNGLLLFASRVYYGDSGGPILTFEREIAGITVAVESHNNLEYPILFGVPISNIDRCKALEERK